LLDSLFDPFDGAKRSTELTPKSPRLKAGRKAALRVNNMEVF
jgi:hypothetical protein